MGVYLIFCVLHIYDFCVPFNLSLCVGWVGVIRIGIGLIVVRYPSLGFLICFCHRS